MNKQLLATELRRIGRTIIDAGDGTMSQDLRDVAELVTTLARVVDGMPVEKAFGAPGDWGYGTPIGEALRQPAAPVAKSLFEEGNSKWPG